MLQLITNARVFAPENLGICHLLLGGGRILMLTDDRDECAISSAHNIDLVEIDLLGKRLLPGFIDGHADVTVKYAMSSKQ